MLEFFPKIQYTFPGITYSVAMTNIFNSVNIINDDNKSILTKMVYSGERPDQLSNRLYQNSKYFWTFFLLNNIKNPLKEWLQTPESYTSQIETEYDGWVYQFANNSNFLPGNTFNFDINTTTNPYNGVDFDGINIGDLIVYETGEGTHSINCLGAGGITSSTSCGSPQYGQSIVPLLFEQQKSVIQTTCGRFFTACLTSNGYIHVWGKDIGLVLPDFVLTSDNYWVSANNGYSFITANGNTLIGIKANRASCFGDCTKFNEFQVGIFDIKKIAWTSSGNNGGIAINLDGSTRHFGFTPFSAMSSPFKDIACGATFCCGILSSNSNAVVWREDFSLSFCTSNVVLGGRVLNGVSRNIAAGEDHVVINNDIVGMTSWGNNSNGQCDVTNFPSGITAIAAGSKFTTALYSDNIRFAGVIANYNNAGCLGDQENFDLTGQTLSGTFSEIKCGSDHIVLQQSGNNKQYLGVISSIDTLYKRIFVKNYQFSEPTAVYLNNPAGTVVSIWRYDNLTQRYKQIKNINHQLLTIQKYLDSTLFINVGGFVLDPSIDNNWNNVYLPNHQTPELNKTFITIKKQLLETKFEENLNINYLLPDKIVVLNNKIKSLIQNNSILEIKTSELT